MTLTRRSFFKSGWTGTALALLSGASSDALFFANENDSTKAGPPKILHQTDLFHPYEDPDDHFDLAVVFALAQLGFIDLAGILLDYPVPDRHPGDSAIVSVAQMNRLTGLAVPAVIGAKYKQKTPQDTLADLSKTEAAGIEFILKTLRESPGPVRIKSGSSAPDVAVAALREPELFRKKCGAIFVNCGAAFPNPQKPNETEYNVQINRRGQIALFNLVPCPVYWFPCWHVTSDWKSGEYGTFFKASQREILKGVSNGFRYYLYYMFSKSQDFQWMRKMETGPSKSDWEKILSGTRFLWATASILMMAGRTVTRDGEIADESEVLPQDALYRLENIRVCADENGNIKWERSEKNENRKIFHVLDVEKYPAAMTRAVNTLFRSFV